jgi:hypothetical protein
LPPRESIPPIFEIVELAADEVPEKTTSPCWTPLPVNVIVPLPAVATFRRKMRVFK